MAFNLPIELLAIITSFSDTETLKALRLTNHMLSAIATKNLFSMFSLNTSDKGCADFESVVAHPQLKEHVRKIRLNTVEEDEYSDEEHDELELPFKWKEVLLTLPNIPNLESVVLRFEKNCSMDDSWTDIPQPADYRKTIIEWLGTGLVSLKQPLKELGIQNQQNVTTPSKDLQQVLSTLSSLRMNVMHELQPSCPENELEKKEVREFYANILPSMWLKPTMGSLRKLSLYANLYWGFYPKFSLEGIHCPNLQSLTLGNFCFFEDQQLDWILSHSSTLQELYLDDCPILFQARILNLEWQLAKCPLPRSSMEFRTGGKACSDGWYYHYPRQWNHYFASFETGLPHLRRFAIGHNEAWRSEDRYSLPFEKELDLVPELMEDRYFLFDGGTGPSQFTGPEYYNTDEDWPQCEDEDRNALKALYRKIKQQVDSGKFEVRHENM
ncbi:Aromatic-ring-hydroxylating dioxygenase alpha subunit [Penicillium cf. griseofulvum]|uniref:Aromatic-ring-hydroxylating dioxygenase alpha subunit n=1 Tax=Penicillium cf. griseofulvum TaxID=2972120 RepID=A0A9W9N0C2_9EURO|nr:Aromatic-ring-hydroxylating dioxygenase alpha subunit [Penicillium cf. griseofulvum]KAJ5422265.1 Aromatic-ring-hydroxylating dioxygenase alpha subunit [Penicillium cf. griseofulvum]